MKKLKKIVSFISFLLITMFITTLVAFSYVKSSKVLSHDLLLSSHLNDHQDSHDQVHVHKHRHSDNEEEHTHKHLNVISFAEIVINKIDYIQFHPVEDNSIVHFSYNIKSYDSYILEILKPPIRG